MDDHELESLFADIESDRVGCKATFTDRDRVCQAICAFANDLPNHQQPGVIFIGVHNNGKCAKLDINDLFLLKPAGIRDDGKILPLPAMIVQKRVLNQCEVAVIIVQPADAPPVSYEGRTWVRVDPRRAIAMLQEERQLAEKRRAKDLPFDLQAVAYAGLEDLD